MVVTMRIVTALGLVTLLGCVGDGGNEELFVAAAASLSDAFGVVAAEFEAAHPEVDVILNFAASSNLREQIIEGAPFDVFASASVAVMGQVVEAGETIGDPSLIALNELQIAVPMGNPAGVDGLDDLANPTLLIGLCAPGVPCGDFAREVLARAEVSPSVDTNEPDVRSLLAKIEAGELDAGITYVTDVASASDRVAGVEIPEEFNVVAEYSIAVLANTGDEDLANAFIEFVLSGGGQAIMTEFGFSSP
jgi:molybdate transport system substrate-binding protein